MFTRSVSCAVLVFVTLHGRLLADEAPPPASAATAEGEKRLSEQVLSVLEHLQQPDPVGLPGAETPDPYPIPDMKHSFYGGDTIEFYMKFKNVTIKGLRDQIRIVSVRTEIAATKVKAAMKIDKLLVAGDYVMSSWLTRSQGPFTVNLTDIFVEGVTNLTKERDGKLRAQEILMDITSKTISMNFENLGFFGSVFQAKVNSVETSLFDSIKPFVLKEASTKIRTEIKANLDKVAGDI